MSSNSNIAEYFRKRNEAWHVPVYEIGDRVRGIYEGIPFSGTVGVDGIRSEEQGPIVTVTLDLPIKVDGEVRTVILVKHKDMGRADKFKFNL
jgi:hypothetical protein